MWFPSYLMSISWRPLSVGWYLIVMVPSLLSVMCGRAVFPDGILTSPEDLKCFHFSGIFFPCAAAWCFLLVNLTCDFSLLWHERDQEINRAEERVHCITRNHWLICGLSVQRAKCHVQTPATQLSLLCNYSVTHHHVEGALWDVLPSKAYRNYIFPRFRGSVVNIKGAIVILHHIHVQLHPLWGLHLAGHLAFPCSLGIHCDDCVLRGLQPLQTCCTGTEGRKIQSPE